MMKKILDYITNNILKQSGNNEPQIPTPTLLNQNVYDYLTVHLPDLDTTQLIPFDVIGSINDEKTGVILYYGFYRTTLQVPYGYMYIVDYNMNPVQLITEFSSGTRMFPIFAMKQDETGHMYALSADHINNICRVLLFNNILIKVNNSYVAKLRNSYIVPNSANINFNEVQENIITKVPNEATYYIVFSFDNQNYTSVYEFKIVVGGTNEWNTYNMDKKYTNIYYTTYTENNSSSTAFYFYSVSSDKYFVEYKISGGSITKTQNILISSDFYYLNAYLFAKDKNNVYISSYDNGDNTLRIHKLANGSFNEIDSISASNFTSYPLLSMKLVGNSIILFLFRYEGSSPTTPYINVGILHNDKIYLSNKYETNIKRPVWLPLASAMSNYNLLRMYVPVIDGTQKFVLDYNPNNYNGLLYSFFNILFPKKARLYSNNELMFARNLYNLTLNGSTQTSTVQVPNTLLNDVIIDQEDLISETNSVLITNDEDIDKNIYETLYVNFIQTLDVLDEDTNTRYPASASYINQNITTGTEQNCSDTFIGKVKINYTTPYIQKITWNYDTDHYETEFTIDTNNEVPTSIDFMSNDETTIYISKELNLISGKYYKINQKLRIE